MKAINYVTGDATEPQGTGRKIIAHVCNDGGAWGAGFVLALSAVDGRPEDRYRNWHRNDGDLPGELDCNPRFVLGEIQFAPFNARATGGVFVCNMIAQHGTSPRMEISMRAAVIPPIRYDALRHCLRKLATAAHAAQASVHMPRIGCGLAGGTWDKVQPIIMQELCAHNIDVTVYDLPLPEIATDLLGREVPATHGNPL